MVLEKGAKLVLGMIPSGLTMEIMADRLRVGDIVLIDGDVPHAGSAYHVANIGLHVYLDVPGVARVRDPHALRSFHVVKYYFPGVAPQPEAPQAEQEQEPQAEAQQETLVQRRSKRRCTRE